MKCNKCGQEVPAGSKFCLNCGNKIEKLCPQCQQPLPENARFCLNCGANLTGASSASAVMKDNVIAGDVNQTVNNYVTNNVNNSVHNNTTVNNSVHNNTTVNRSVHHNTTTVDNSVHTNITNVYQGDAETPEQKENRRRLESADYKFETRREGGKQVSVIKQAANFKTSMLTLPQYDWEGNPVVEVGDRAFYTNNRTGLNSITIPEGYLRIGNEAFRDWSSITSISLPNTLQTIGAQAFFSCDLRSVTIPDNVCKIGKGAFANYNLRSFNISKNNRYYCVLNDCLIETASKTLIRGTNNIIPRIVEEIGDYAFYASSISEITVPDCVRRIGADAFNYCRSLKSVTLPDSVERIGGRAFAGCESLTHLDFGKGVKHIGYNAVDWCRNLKNVTLPESVTTLEKDAFNTFKSIEFLGTRSQWAAIEAKANQVYEQVTCAEERAAKEAQKAEKARQAAEARKAAERRAQNLCQYCGGPFKGLFTKSCQNCGRKKDY